MANPKAPTPTDKPTKVKLTKKEREKRVKKLFFNPPSTGGKMLFIQKEIEDETTGQLVANPAFDQTKIDSVKTALKEIKDTHIPTVEVPVADLFYIVSEYNKANVGAEINGDTATELLVEEASEEVM